MPPIQSVQLMFRIVYQDGTVAMVAMPPDEINDAMDASLTTDTEGANVLAAFKTQSETIHEHLTAAGGTVYQQATSEAAARRAEAHAEAKLNEAYNDRRRAGSARLKDQLTRLAEIFKQADEEEKVREDGSRGNESSGTSVERPHGAGAALPVQVGDDTDHDRSGST